MDHLSFFPFHNRHIRFTYDGVELHGVVVDSIPFNEKAFSTQYVFISSDDMIDWKDAERRQDFPKMKELEKKIDILNISQATLI